MVVELSRDIVMLIATMSNLEKGGYRKGVSTVIDFEVTDYCFV